MECSFSSEHCSSAHVNKWLLWVCLYSGEDKKKTWEVKVFLWLIGLKRHLSSKMWSVRRRAEAPRSHADSPAWSDALDEDDPHAISHLICETHWPINKGSALLPKKRDQSQVKPQQSSTAFYCGRQTRSILRLHSFGPVICVFSLGVSEENLHASQLATSAEHLITLWSTGMGTNILLWLWQCYGVYLLFCTSANHPVTGALIQS